MGTHSSANTSPVQCSLFPYNEIFVDFRRSLPFEAAILFTTKAYQLHLFEEGHLTAVYLGHPWLRLRQLQ